MPCKKYSKLETIILYEHEQLIKSTSPQKTTKQTPPKAKRKKQRYDRDEAAYNAHQENEFFFFITTLPFIVFNALQNSELQLNAQNFKRFLIAHICLAIKDYFGTSLRRSMGLIKFIFWAMKWKCTIPCFKTLDNYMNRHDTKKIQNEILEFSVSPLKYIETRFSIDSTNESLTTASTWYNFRIKKEIRKKDHLKEHITSTAKYNAAVAVDISQEGDAKFIASHVQKITKQGFTLKHLCGDKAYLTRDGCNDVCEAGGKAHFKIKNNTTTNAKGSQEWKRMVTAQKNNDPQEIEDYNIRQNAESTNHAKKAKFGSRIRSKRNTSREAEAMGKWCVYNITAICRAYYDNAVEPTYYLNSSAHIERMLTYT